MSAKNATLDTLLKEIIALSACKNWILFVKYSEKMFVKNALSDINSIAIENALNLIGNARHSMKSSSARSVMEDI